jgi:hypothetical protein
MAAIGQSLYAGSLPTVWLARTRCRYNAIITVRVARQAPAGLLAAHGYRADPCAMTSAITSHMTPICRRSAIYVCPSGSRRRRPILSRAGHLADRSRPHINAALPASVEIRAARQSFAAQRREFAELHPAEGRRVALVRRISQRVKIIADGFSPWRRGNSRTPKTIRSCSARRSRV